MVSSFNIEKLYSLLKDFYTLTHIRITVFNESFVELTAYPPNISPLCQLIRTDNVAYEKCKQCDQRACKIAAKHHNAYTYQCHAGLTECIVPLFVSNLVVGYLFLGQVLNYKTHDDAFQGVFNACSNYTLNMQSLESLCREHPLSTDDYILAASSISQAVASYVCLERMATLNQKEISVQINNYISSHFTEPLNATIICNHFQIGKTYLYELSNKYFGKGIAEYIRFLRIEKAKKLLIEESGLRIAEVSAQCGFNDYNYFITVFKKEVGMSPKQFAKINAP